MNHSEPRQYTRDEVDRIIRRALRLKRDELINHDELLEMAEELGVDSQTMEAAVEEEQETFDYKKAWKLKMIRRKAKFHRHLWSFIIIIGALIIINIMTPGPWWFQWPVLGWGIGLAFHFRAAYFPAGAELESELLNGD
jgi:hypothetical protein